jgi:hypothetical protein
MLPNPTRPGRTLPPALLPAGGAAEAGGLAG